MVMLATVAVTGYLYVIIPKGFFPQQDTGLILGQSEAAQDISYQAMVGRMQAVLGVVMDDPAVSSIGSAIGANGNSPSLNQGRVYMAYPDSKGGGGTQKMTAGKVIGHGLCTP